MITAELKYTETVSMITEVCCKCGVAFGMPSTLQKALKDDSNKSFYCPNGHGQHYSKSTATIMRERFDKEKEITQQQIEHLQNKLIDTLSQKNKVETKLKRVHKGVCPCSKTSRS
ncbi:MAG TPA: hypothetical protein VK590_13390 [Saprospiraceae bacterium]|nr:hypothetical protein [Saprospiraceae bacterium]